MAQIETNIEAKNGKGVGFERIRRITGYRRARPCEARHAALRSAFVLIQQTINIAGIMEDSIVDGPGLRTAIFAQGCPRRCEGCHNPESWAFGTGTDMTVQDLFWRVKKNPLVRGVTFSGGEPFSQAEPFTELAKLLKANGYEVASYTGYTFEELLENGTPAQKQLLAALDILVDGEFVLAQRNLDLRFRGSENQRILDVPQSLAQGRAVWCTAARWVGERQA